MDNVPLPSGVGLFKAFKEDFEGDLPKGRVFMKMYMEEVCSPAFIFNVRTIEHALDMFGGKLTVLGDLGLPSTTTHVVVMNMTAMKKVGLEDGEVRAILYHELGHKHNGDVSYPAVRKPRSLHAEMEADRFASINGHGKEMRSALLKLAAYITSRFNEYPERDKASAADVASVQSAIDEIMARCKAMIVL